MDTLTLLGPREDGDDLIARLPLLRHRGEGLGAVIGGERMVLPPAAEDRAAHPHGWSGRLVLHVPIITHGPRERVEEREKEIKEEWVEGERSERSRDKEEKELELEKRRQERRRSTTERDAMSDADVKQETLKHNDRQTPICTTNNKCLTDMDF